MPAPITTRTLVHELLLSPDRYTLRLRATASRDGTAAALCQLEQDAQDLAGAGYPFPRFTAALRNELEGAA